LEIEHPIGFFTVDMDVETVVPRSAYIARRCCAPRANSCEAKCSSRDLFGAERNDHRLSRHFTTAPEPHQQFRDRQLARFKNPALPEVQPAEISDDEIRATIETNQLNCSANAARIDVVFATGFGDGASRRR